MQWVERNTIQQQGGSEARAVDFFICEAGYEARVDVVATTSCKKLVVDMHYEE